MLRTLHEALHERGTSSVGMSVFGWNTWARALYEGLGYVLVEVLLSRRLTPAPDRTASALHRPARRT